LLKGFLHSRTSAAGIQHLLMEPAGAERICPAPPYFLVERNHTMVTLLARRTDRKSKNTKPRLESLEERSLLAAAVPGVTLDPLTIPKFVNTLDPNVLALGSPGFEYQPSGTAVVTLQNGKRATVPLYHVGAYQIQEDLGLGLKDANGKPITTTVYAFGTSAATATYPGHTFNVQSNKAIAVQWANGLTSETHLLPVDSTVLGPNADSQGKTYYAVTTDPKTGVQSVIFASGIPITPHLHGGHTDAAYDGTPQQWLTATGPNQQVGPDFTSNPYVYDNTQQAGTLWYHDHMIGLTRLNNYAGLNGFYIIHDSNENKLIAHHRLPDESYDIPLVIQDRMFTTGGQLYYPAEPLPGEPPTAPPPPPPDPSILLADFGDTILVDGQAWPVMHVEPRMYRFRVLNGSNARFYNLQFSIQDQNPNQPSDQQFFQIGTDDGLLKKPVPLDNVLIAPGERADIVVDFSKLAGKTLIVTNDAKAPYPPGWSASNPTPQTTGQIMEFRVDTPLNPNIPDADRFSTTATMNTTIVPFGHVDQTRELALYVNKDPSYGRPLLRLGTLAGPTPFIGDGSMPEIIKQGAVEKWVIYNTTDHTHPIHLHQVAFQIISRQQFDYESTPTGGIKITRLIGKPVGPAPNEAGWKDTVQVNPGEAVTIEAQFDLPGKYVWHCHILEHEEHDMMHYFIVEPSTAAQKQAAAQLAARGLLPTSFLDPAKPKRGTNAARSPVHATASPTVSSTTKTVAPGVRTGAPNSSATDGAIPLLNGQIGSLPSTDEENPIDRLAADILTSSRKTRR
jgi:spore coat protein A